MLRPRRSVTWLLERAGSLRVLGTVAAVLALAVVLVLAGDIRATNRDVEQADEAVAAAQVQIAAVDYLTALLAERGTWVAVGPDGLTPDDLRAAQRATDAAAERLGEVWNDNRQRLDGGEFDAVVTDAAMLSDIRAELASGASEREETVERLNRVVDGVAAASNDLTLAMDDEVLLRNRRVVTAVIGTLEDLAAQRLLLLAVLDGDEPLTDQLRVEIRAVQRDIERDIRRLRQLADDEVTTVIDGIVDGPEWTRAEILADEIESDGARGDDDIGTTTWFEAASRRVAVVESVADVLDADLLDQARANADSARRARLFRGGALGILTMTSVLLVVGGVVAARQRQRAADEYESLARGISSWFLPESLPDVPDCQIEARYLPAASHARAGGDWYDVLPVEGGVVAIVGDVVGHGPQAAVDMTLVRNRLLGLVSGGDACSDVDALDERLDDADVMATLAYVVLDVDEHAIRYCRNGHLPPLLRHPHGAVERLDEGGGPPIGVRLRTARTQGQRLLQPGSLLVMYTDGLVEEPGAGFEARTAMLEATVAEDHADLGVLADAILDVRPPGPQRDDIALLLVRFVPGSGGR